MNRKLFALLLILIPFCASAQDDSLRSPFSVFGGAGIGAGYLLGGFGELPRGYDDLQFEQKPYADIRMEAGVLWNEKFGVAVLAGQLGNTNDGSAYTAYANEAEPGYRFLHEYSDLHFGYTYRYITPQFMYRLGREPFNITFRLGGGLGTMHNAHGIAIYQKDSSNLFKQITYTANNAMNSNISLGADFAYMRQLSQHWFLNAGVSLSYTGILQNYEILSEEQNYQQQFPLPSTSTVSGILHHFSTGIFLQFQWNTKESARAYYE